MAREVSIIRALMVRRVAGADPGLPRRPILVIDGGPQTGKSELCKQMMLGYAGAVPCAYVDVAAVEARFGDVVVPKVLAGLAQQLARRTGRYGAIQFERLAVGLLAMGLDLSADAPGSARPTVTDMLKTRAQFARLQRVSAVVAKDVLALLPGWVPANTVQAGLDGGLAALATRARTRRGVLGVAQQWYGHQDRGLDADSVDELVALNPTTPGYFPAVNAATGAEVLCAAFLADLRAHFRRRRARDWTLHCLILLDNVDSPVARGLLHLLARVQEGARADGVDRWDPVAVVATGRGATLSDLAPDRRGAVHDVRTAAEATAAVDKPVEWLRYRMPPLNADQIVKMLGNPQRPGSPPLWRRATVLHQLSGGNPGGVALLLPPVAAAVTDQIEPANLLRPGSQLTAALEERLLSGLPADALETIISCSLARNRAEGRKVFAWLHGPDQARARLLPGYLWDPTGEVPVTLVRLLLLRRLAARRSGHEWSVVGASLIQRCAKDPEAALHYRLASGRLDETARLLADRLPRVPMPAWLRLLDKVASAPRGPVVATPDPDAAGAPPYVRTLVADLQAVRDPMHGTDRGGLYWRLSSAFRELSQEREDSSDALLDRIFYYEELARRWSGLPWSPTPVPLPR